MTVGIYLKSSLIKSTGVLFNEHKTLSCTEICIKMFVQIYALVNIIYILNVSIKEFFENLPGRPGKLLPVFTMM